MDIKKYQEAGKIAKEAREYGANLIKEGVSYYEVANKVEKYILDAGAKPAFPVNISVNNIAAHYTPVKNDGKYFRKGDVVKLDLGTHIGGYIADTALTVEVAQSNWDSLIEASREALKAAIKHLRPGVKVSEIGRVIEEEISIRGYRPIRNLTGHSLERYSLHHGLNIPNYDDGSAAMLTPGMAFAIEPFATNGKGRVREGYGGNIYIFRHYDSLKSPYAEMFARFKTLPFAARWCEDMQDFENILKKGVKRGILYQYPILQERKKYVVSQTEHTVVMTADGIIVTTE